MARGEEFRSSAGRSPTAHTWGGGSTARTPTREELSPLPPIAWALQERDAKGADSSTKPGHLIPVGGVFDAAIGFAQNQRDEVRTMEVAGALPAEPGMKQTTYIAQPAVAFHNRQDPDVSGDVTHPLGAKDNGLGLGLGMKVRRLLPVECEKLQGFPPGYTAITVRGKPAADGPRYRALGNSMAVNCMSWIGQRIQSVIGYENH
mgnify:FL=1